MYECRKLLFQSEYEREYTAQEKTGSKMKEIIDIYNYVVKEVRSINREMRGYIDSCHKEPERRAVYLEHSTEYFEDIENIAINSSSLIMKYK